VLRKSFALVAALALADAMLFLRSFGNLGDLWESANV
jgi:hypothetical protein